MAAKRTYDRSTRLGTSMASKALRTLAVVAVPRPASQSVTAQRVPRARPRAWLQAVGDDGLESMLSRRRMRERKVGDARRQAVEAWKFVEMSHDQESGH